uniref:Dynein heavy chain coiled coil stalk domain-containing protein n=1 Tax=Ciona savignyi TaxID=51511 RepID=H2Z7K6_CIOSA
MRKQLKKAIKSREEPQLEESIKKYKTIEPTKSLDSLVKKAKNLLEMLKCSKGLSSAVLSRVIADIQSAVDRIKKGGFDELSSDVASAEKLLLRLRHLERLRSEVLELKQSTIAELRSYKQPIPVIHNVMKATYMLLGVPENETKKWSSIQTLLGKTGKDGLKRRISTFKETSVTLEIARRAKHLIGQEEDLESIRDVSAGAATFYLWVTGMVEEVLHNAQ